MMFAPAPFLLKDVSVSQVMIQVCVALIPGIAAYAWLIGPAILVQLVIATLAALLAEAAMLHLQKKPLAIFLSDGSAIVTAWLIALTFPPLAPWWLVATGTMFAIVVAKHLYGGLGQNPFNPAMVAFAVCIVSFPALMSQWPSIGLQLPFVEQINVILGLAPRVDALSGATPLDAMKTALKLGDGSVNVASCWPTRTSSAISPGAAGNGSLPATCSAASGCGNAS
jgi:electron transport complex protein RnfD